MARTADFESRTGLPARLAHTGGMPPPLPPETTHHLLAITSEALENIHRHAAATAAEVSLKVTPDTLHLTIEDDGVGLPPALTLEEAQESGHFGLLGMAERAARAGAALHLGSDGTGTAVTLTLPLPAPPDGEPSTPGPPRQEAAHA
jgi:signal transduction histidine kinase